METPARIERYLPMLPRSWADVRLKRMVKSSGGPRDGFRAASEEVFLAHSQRQVWNDAFAGLAERVVIDLRPPENLENAA